MRRLPGTAAVLAGAWLASAALGGPIRPPEEGTSRPPVPPRPADRDLEEIRDIFRFADEEAQSPRPPDVGLERTLPAVEAPVLPPGPRLVGLIRGGAGLRAAIAVEGEVVVLGPGESALGYTVVDVGEEEALLVEASGLEWRLSLDPTAPAR